MLFQHPYVLLNLQLNINEVWLRFIGCKFKNSYYSGHKTLHEGPSYITIKITIFLSKNLSQLSTLPSDLNAVL